MAEVPSTTPLTQRLVVERLAAPGILDRQRLQRAHDRFSHPPTTPVPGYLQRRIASAMLTPGSLPLVRVDRSAEPGADVLANPAATAGTPVTTLEAAATSIGGAAGGRSSSEPIASPAIASSVVGALVTRQAPSLTRANEFVARRVGGERGLVDSSRTIARLIERSAATASSGAPSITRSALITGVVQRVADNRDTPRAGVVGEQTSASIGLSPTVVAEASYMATRPSPFTVTPTVLRQAKPSADVPRDPAIATTLRGASASSAAPISAPLLWRKPDAPAHINVTSGPAATASSPAITAASTPLLLRKPDAAVLSSQPATQTPRIATSAAGVIARKAGAVEPTPTERAQTSTASIDIDWIAEQVGNRLARRLEIERERLGVRQWRQVS